MKKLFTVLLSLLLALSLFGCTKEQEQGGEKEPVKVTIWHTYTKEQKEYLEKAVSDFNASQSDIIVEAVAQASGLEATTYQAVYAGEGPDMIINYASEAAKYVADEKVADLGKYLPKSLIDSLDAGAKEEATSFSDGKMHVLPIVLSGPVLFYNPRILEAAGVSVPTTWDELYAAAKTISEKVTVKTNEDGTHELLTDGSGDHVYGYAVDSPTDVAQTIIMQNNADVFDVKTNTCAFDTEAVRTELQKYGDGVQSGYILGAPTIDNYFSSNYNTETLAMYIGSVAGAPYLSAEWEVAKVPATPNGKAWTPAWNRGFIVFANGEARETASCKFIEYFTGAEVNAGWCEACNYLSCFGPTKETQTYKNMLASDKKNVAALNALQPETAGSFIAVPAIAYVRTALKTLMSDLAAGTSMDVAMKNAYDYVAGELD